MNPEILIKTNINALREITKEYVSEEEYDKLFQNWEVFKKWLIEIPFTDRDSTLLYVAEHYLPQTRPYIELSLSLHSDFWNEFYLNLLKAKALLTA